MERQTTPPDPPGPGGDDPAFDPESFVREAYERQAAWERQGAPPPPPRPGLDPTALFVLLDGLRRVVPRELEDQMANLIREFLLTLRSLIDWYLERLDRPAREPRVEDIPID
ncbi:MAG TPA: hypothetical protein VIM03_00925 [Thermoleophilaceae bacterium]|jgi:hypothetical protein